MNEESVKKASLPRRIALFSLKALAGLILLCVLVIGGALVWLRTEGASSFIAETVTKQLSSLGLELKMGPISGTLPRDLELSGIVLSDREGVFFKAEKLRLETRLTALMKGSLEIAELSVDRPEVFRLPVLPPSEEKAEEPEEASGSVPSLPFGIRVDLIALRQGLLHGAVLQPNGVADTVFALDLSGAASLKGSSLAARLNLDFVNAQGSGVKLDLDLDAASGIAGLYAQAQDQNAGNPAPVTDAAAKKGEDSLTLSLEMREGENGLISLVTSNPALPRFVFALQGNGPVRDWRAKMAVLAGGKLDAAAQAVDLSAAQQAKADLASLAADITMQCRTGSLWKDLLAKPDFGLELQTTLRGGPEMPESVLPLLGDRVKAGLRLTTEPAGYGISLLADSNAWRVNISEAHIAPRQSEGAESPWIDAEGRARDKGLAIEAVLEAAVTDIAALAGGQSQNPPPLQSLALNSTLSALADGNFNGLTAGGSIKLGGVSTGGIAAAGEQESASTEDFSLDYTVAARMTDARINLDSLLLQGMGISLRGSANADTATRQVNADISLDAADHADWQELLARLGGFASPGEPSPLGGAVNLALNLHLPPQAEKPEAAPDDTSATTLLSEESASGRLSLRASNMRWPSPQLDNIVGPDITLSATLSGGMTLGSATPYTLHLDEISAGILKASGSASFLPEVEQRAGAPLPAGRLEAALLAELSDLAPLASAQPGQAPIAGPLKAEVQAKGPLDALSLNLKVQSPALSAAGQPLKDISLVVDADTALNDKAAAASGKLAFSLGQSPGGPVTLGSNWRVHMPQGAESSGQAMTAAVESLALHGAGVELNANVTAALPLALQGKVKAEVKDWKKLAAVSGAPLAGGPAGFTLDLKHGGQGQEASLDLQLASLRMQQQGGPPSFVIRNVKALLNASGLPDKLNLDLALETGRGVAGPLRWNSGTGSVKGSDNNGDFALSLLARGRGSRGQNKPGGQASARKGKSRAATQAELLILQGAYDLNKMEVLLNTFAMNESRSKTGLQLEKPLTVNLAKGISVQGLDMGFKPGGKLTADADISPGKLELKARLEALPFSFFKMFTSATMPDGQLLAEADFRTSASGPQGNFKVQSQVSATQDVSGVVRPDAPSTASVFELLLEGNLAANPGESAVAGAGVRTMPGVIWLRGTGQLGDSAKAGPQREGQLGFQIPLRPNQSGIPLPDARAPMAVKLAWNGPIDSLWQAVPMPDRYLSGNTLLDLNISGNMDVPKLLVSAFMAGGRFQDIPNGILISGISLEARNTEDGNVRALVAAKDNLSGSLAVEANLTGLSGKAGETPALAVRGQLDEFAPLHRDDLSIYLSGIFGLNGPLSDLDVTADIAVDRGEFTISSKLGGSVPTLEVVNKKRADKENPAAVEEDEEVPVAAGPKLAVRVRIPRYFFIRGMGINSEWEGDLRVTGLASAPSLVGSLKPVRGSIDLLSRTFGISEGEITFTGGMDINPALDLTLINEGPNITAYIHATGSAKKPKLELTSRPPLPQDEVLAMVLFGKRTSELSRFEAIQLANSLRELSGVGGSSLDVLTGVRKSLGLDMLRVGGGESATKRSTTGQSGEGNLGAPSAGDSSDAGAPTLEAGKYINDSIYVGVEQGATQESTAVRVEVELFPSITLQGKSTSESSEVGIGWKMDY